MSEPNDEPQVRDVRPKVPPVLPANMQARLLGVIALIMVLVIAFSGRKPVHESKSASAAPTPAITEPNQSRIQEYQTTIDDATRKLAAEEAELTQAKRAVQESALLTAPGGRDGTSANSATPAQNQYEPDVMALQAERQKRDYQSLFASNIALSYRPPTLTAPTALPVLAPSVHDAQPAPAPVRLAKDSATDEYRLLEGTIFETVLTNRLDSSFSGPVDCMVTTNIYSSDHSALLVPQGSRVLGEARKVEGVGDQRLAVTFHRLIRPDGYSLSLDRFLGLDQIGETGLRDQINHHYPQIFGASIAIGAIAGLAQANANYGVNETAASAYQQGVASSLSQSSLHILDRFLNVMPTFTIREGQRIKIYLSQDVTLPTYEPRKGDLP